MAGDAGALAADGILRDLDDHFLALLEEVLDVLHFLGPAWRFAIVVASTPALPIAPALASLFVASFSTFAVLSLSSLSPFAAAAAAAFSAPLTSLPTALASVSTAFARLATGAAISAQLPSGRFTLDLEASGLSLAAP